MRKTVSEQITYQQALDDFGVTELMSHIRNYADQDFNAALMNLEGQELECLAAILIQRLTSSLNGKLITGYLNAIRHGNSHVIFDPTNLEIPSPAIDPPDNFPDGVTPSYAEGDRIRWRPLTNTTDWGVALGHFYAYAQYQCQWAVCYLVKLDLRFAAALRYRNSPSAAWIAADTAWEEDLEPNTDNSWEQSSDGDNFFGDCTKRTNETDCTTNLHALQSVPLSPCPTPDVTNRTASTPIYTRNGHVLPTLRKNFPSVHAPSGRYHADGTGGSNPRTLTQQQRDLIELYSNCQLGLTPMKFYAKWSVRYEELASICSRSTSTVERWFNRGHNYRRPTFNDLRHLAIMDFLLEHFEEIPSQLLNLLCSPNRSQF